MAKIHIQSKTSNPDDILRRDLLHVEQEINGQQSILELDSRTADPSVTSGTGKIKIWYRSDLNEIRFNENGTVYKIAATAA